MVSFYFAIFLILIILFVKIGLYYSKTKIIIKNIDIDNNDFKYNVWVSIYLFNKIKFLNFKFSEKGLRLYFIFLPYKKILKENKIEKITENFFKKITINKIKNLKFSLEEINFRACLGIDDVFITINLITIISTLLSYLIARKTTNSKFMKVKTYNKKNKRKYKFLIKPCFDNKLYIDGIISLSFKTRNFSIFLNPKEHNKFKLLVGG